MKRLAYMLLLLPSLALGQVARFGLVAGSNRGQERKATLRYAQRDAERFARLLVDLGGFEKENVVLLEGAGVQEFRAAFSGMKRRIGAVVPQKAPRALLVVYFSGHSDGVNLEFGPERLGYGEFRKLVEESGAGIQIAFIDSCQSGGLAAVKGSGPARSGVGMFLHYGLSSGALKNYAAVHQAIVGLRLDLGPASLFPRFAYGEASIQADSLDYFIRMYSLESTFAWRFEYSVLDIFAGVLLGLSYGSQYLARDREFSGTMFTYGAVGGIDLPLWQGLALQVFWEVGARVFSLNDRISQHLALQGVVGLGYEF